MTLCVYVCVMYCCQLIHCTSFRLSGAPCLPIFLVAPGWRESMSSKLWDVWTFATWRELWRSGDCNWLAHAFLSSTARPLDIVWCWQPSLYDLSSANTRRLIITRTSTSYQHVYSSKKTTDRLKIRIKNILKYNEIDYVRQSAQHRWYTATSHDIAVSPFTRFRCLELLQCNLRSTCVFFIPHNRVVVTRCSGPGGIEAMFGKFFLKVICNNYLLLPCKRIFTLLVTKIQK